MFTIDYVTVTEILSSTSTINVYFSPLYSSPVTRSDNVLPGTCLAVNSWAT